MVVEDFVMQNQYGNIRFIGPMDLTGVDLKQDVIISHKLIEVYPECTGNLASRPKKGQKLNKPAVIQLHDIKPKPGQSKNEEEERLKRKIESKGGKHLSYIDHTWEFQVPYIGEI